MDEHMDSRTGGHAYECTHITRYIDTAITYWDLVSIDCNQYDIPILIILTFFVILELIINFSQKCPEYSYQGCT